MSLVENVDENISNTLHLFRNENVHKGYMWDV
jgi:hypothetical protein